MKNIELELRAPIPKKDFARVKNLVVKMGKTKDEQERLSLIFFGTMNGSKIDLRIRIDKKHKAQIVLKKGEFHAHNRIEKEILIEPKTFMPFAEMFGSLGLSGKIMERTTLRVQHKDKIEIALVSSGGISYLEVERICTKEQVEIYKKKLLEILNFLSLKPILNKRDFDILCNTLSTETDTTFNEFNSVKNVLQKKIAKYIKTQK